MAWDFSTEPEFQAKLDWVDEFVASEVEPLDLAFANVSPFNKSHPVQEAIIRPLQDEVKKQKLWACHMGPEIGGAGYGQVKLGLLNEILGRSSWAPSVFGCQAPDSGNAEVLAHFGTDEQKKKYLEPLLDGRISSTYSMTEPQAGADPAQFTCAAVKDGDEWVINGEKWFASNFPHAEFLIVMIITNPDVAIYAGSSMFLIPKETEGLELVRNVATGTGPIGRAGGHAYLRFNDARVPAENLLGEEGAGFKIAQTRLGGGRVHHAMRSVGVVKKAFDMMCERALSRETKGSLLAEKQAVEHMVAECWIQILQFRLQVLHTAWVIDNSDYSAARTHIAGVKVATPKVLTDVIYKAMHLHGSLGVSNELPLTRMWEMAPTMGIADGPTEVHKTTIARNILKDYRPAPGLFPTEHLPPKIEEAKKKFADFLEGELEHEIGNG